MSAVSSRSRRVVLAVLAVVSVVLGACACEKQDGSSPDAPANPAGTQLANPASVNCIDVGGKLEIRREDGGGEVGICVFPDGTECEEWALFRKQCAPGQGR